MFENRTPRGVSALALAVSVFVAPQSRPTPGPAVPLSVRQALETYAAEPNGELAQRLTAQRDYYDLLQRYRRDAGRWIADAVPSDRTRRQHVAAGLAMELVAASLDESYGYYLQSQPLIEWTCELLTKNPTSEFERMTQLASIAALQGAGDYSLLGIDERSQRKPGHLDHAMRRFPSEDRLGLARVLARPEARVIAAVPLKPADIVPAAMYRPMGEDAAARLDNTLKILASLDGPLVRDEARLRRGVLQFLTGSQAEASTDLGMTSTSADPFVAYLANVVLGSLYYGSGQTSAAVGRYSTAVHITPATSARLGLAAALMKQGQTQDAAGQPTALFAQKRIDDPWRLYGLGLFHELPKYLAAMRAEIR